MVSLGDGYLSQQGVRDLDQSLKEWLLMRGDS